MLTFEGYCNYVFASFDFTNVPGTLKRRRERKKEKKQKGKRDQGLSEPLKLRVPKEKFAMN